MSKMLIVVLTLVASGALAQAANDLPPPPLVPSSPPPTPAPEPGAPPLGTNPGTPPPPAALPPSYQPSPSYVPGQQPSGYQYSPYGQPMNRGAPAPEVGLMITESLFGMLTAAGVTVLPYLLFKLTGLFDSGDPTIATILLLATVAVAPLSVAQTQVGIANGSSYYHSESWIPLLTGLAGEALIVLTYYFANGSALAPPTSYGSTGGVAASQAPIIYLLVGSAVIVPVLQMVAINLFKQPKYRPVAEAETGKKPLVALGLPAPIPLLTQTATGSNTLSLGVSLLNGTW